MRQDFQDVFFNTYSVFHRFRQTKFAYVVLILSSIKFFVTASAASKNGTHNKSGQNWLKNNQLTTPI